MFHKMKIHDTSYFAYRHPFYINNVPADGELSSLTQLFSRHSKLKTRVSHYCANKQRVKFVLLMVLDLILRLIIHKI